MWCDIEDIGDKLWFSSDFKRTVCDNTTCLCPIDVPASPPRAAAVCCLNVTPFRAKCSTARSDKPSNSVPIIEPFMCLSGASNGHWVLRVAILARSGTAADKAALLQDKSDEHPRRSRKNGIKGRSRTR